MLYFCMLPIGTQITLKRLEKKMTQAQLSQAAGIPQPNLSKIEKGKQDLTVTTLCKIAYALGVPPADFFKQDDSNVTKSISLSRPQIEKIANAVWDKRIALNEEEKNVRDLLCDLLIRNKKRSSMQIQRSWLRLKNKFDSAAIHSLCERVRERQARYG